MSICFYYHKNYHKKTFVPMFDRVFHVNIVMLYYNIKYDGEDIKNALNLFYHVLHWGHGVMELLGLRDLHCSHKS